MLTEQRPIFIYKDEKEALPKSRFLLYLIGENEDRQYNYSKEQIFMPHTIVVIEDEALLLKALNIELLSSDFQVFSALDGELGLAIVQEKKPDLVLLDLVLPKKTGFQVLQELKQDPALKNIPVVILSNLGQQEDQKHALDLGAADYFIKSNTDLTQLTEKIKTIIQNKRNI